MLIADCVSLARWFKYARNCRLIISGASRFKPNDFAVFIRITLVPVYCRDLEVDLFKKHARQFLQSNYAECDGSFTAASIRLN